MQGYKQHRGYIIAQAPMESTCRDFWKTVYDRRCGVIIMLSDLMEQEKVSTHTLLLLPKVNTFNFLVVRLSICVVFGNTAVPL